MNSKAVSNNFKEEFEAINILLPCSKNIFLIL